MPVGLEPRPEILFRSHRLPLDAFVPVDPGFDPTALREIPLVLDDTPSGVRLLDGIDGRGES